MREASILHQCMLALSDAGCTVFRANVARVRLEDGRWLSSGLPIGFSDLFGFRRDARAFFVEVKSPTGRLRPEQAAFIAAMRARGAIAGVARSPEDAVALVLGFSHP